MRRPACQSRESWRRLALRTPVRLRLFCGRPFRRTRFFQGFQLAFQAGDLLGFRHHEVVHQPQPLFEAEDLRLQLPGLLQFLRQTLRLLLPCLHLQFELIHLAPELHHLSPMFLYHLGRPEGAARQRDEQHPTQTPQGGFGVHGPSFTVTVISIRSKGLSLPSFLAFRMASTISMPRTTSPNTVYCQSRLPQSSAQMKNWEPALLGSLPRAMDSVPRRWGRLLNSAGRSEEHTSELQSPCNLVCRLLLEKKKKQ